MHNQNIIKKIKLIIRFCINKMSNSLLYNSLFECFFNKYIIKEFYSLST